MGTATPWEERSCMHFAVVEWHAGGILSRSSILFVWEWCQIVGLSNFICNYGVKTTFRDPAANSPRRKDARNRRWRLHGYRHRCPRDRATYGWHGFWLRFTMSGARSVIRKSREHIVSTWWTVFEIICLNNSKQSIHFNAKATSWRAKDLSLYGETDEWWSHRVSYTRPQPFKSDKFMKSGGW